MSNYIRINTPDTISSVNLDQIVFMEYRKDTKIIKFVTNNSTVPELSVPISDKAFNSIAEKIGINGIKDGSEE